MTNQEASKPSVIRTASLSYLPELYDPESVSGEVVVELVISTGYPIDALGPECQLTSDEAGATVRKHSVSDYFVRQTPNERK